MNKQVGGQHYQLPIQPIDYIVKNGLGYREGNVVKYVSRHASKNGAEDIRKAIHYLEMILEDYDVTQSKEMEQTEERYHMLDSPFRPAVYHDWEEAGCPGLRSIDRSQSW